MRFVTFLDTPDSIPQLGLVLESPTLKLDCVVHLSAAFKLYEKHVRHSLGEETFIVQKYGDDLLGLIERYEAIKPALEEILLLVKKGQLGLNMRPLHEVTLLSPLVRPTSMRDGYAFRQHVLTARKNRGLDMIPEFDEFPVFYFTNHQSVVGPGVVKVMPAHLDKLDFELEVAVVIGKKGRNIPASKADEYIFGMMVMNDWSARGLQMQEMKLSLGPAKGKDFATSLGPYLVTLDELASQTRSSTQGNHYHLAMKAYVNGEQVSSGNVQDMNWTFAQIIERVSYGVDVYPGDVIGSGTCGTGCFLELNGSNPGREQWLKVGDKVELEIEKLGRLQNVIQAMG